MTNQPNREWIYRMAFEAGRHIIGYEGPHTIHDIGTFAFLRKHLNPPRISANGRE